MFYVQRHLQQAPILRLKCDNVYIESLLYRIVLQLKDYFTGYPSQLAVAEAMLNHGISVRDDDAYVRDIKQSDSALARAIGVDRRVVRSTIERILMNDDLSALFSRINCMADLSNAASFLGGSAIETVPEDDSRPGLMADIMNIVSQARLNVRQAVVSAGGDGEPTHLIITVDGNIDGSTLSSIRAVPGIASLIIR